MTCYRFLSLIVLLFSLASQSIAQQAVPCIGTIMDRLIALGNQTDFDFNVMRQVMDDFPHGKLSDALADPNKLKAFERTFTSLAEFCDLAGSSLSAKGMKGYTKLSGTLMKVGDSTRTEINIGHLQEAFKKSGAFKSIDFDSVMKKLGDESLFDFDPVSKTFSSKRSPAKYAPHPNGSYGPPGREADSLSHILRGHTDNEFTAINPKSVFSDASRVLDLIDDAMQPGVTRNPAGGGAFWVDLSPTVVGKDLGGQDTSRIFIVIRSGTADVIHTAYPY